MKALVKVGAVSREQLGKDGPYSGSRAKQWGRTGPPAAVEAMAAPYKLGAAALLGQLSAGGGGGGGSSIGRASAIR